MKSVHVEQCFLLQSTLCSMVEIEGLTYTDQNVLYIHPFSSDHLRTLTQFACCLSQHDVIQLCQNSRKDTHKQFWAIYKYIFSIRRYVSRFQVKSNHLRTTIQVQSRSPKCQLCVKYFTIYYTNITITKL